MEQLYVFILRNDIWIYILSSIALVWYLAEYWRSRRLLKSAIFGLEKEKGSRIRNRSLVLVFLFIAIIGLVTYVNLSVAPTLPEELLRPPTPTPNVFSTRLSPPTPLAPDGSTTVFVAPTVTLAGVAPPGSQPTSEPTQEEETTPTPGIELVTGDCGPEVIITSPPDGTAVQGSLTLFGTATGENFNSYSLAYLGSATAGEWQVIFEVFNEPVLDGILGTIDLQSWPIGTYYLRLLALDQENAEIGQCVIELLVGEELS
jgi:hypothetical protein